MPRRALWSTLVGLCSVVLLNGCTPGPVTARAAHDPTGAGAAGGSSGRAIGRDAAMSATGLDAGAAADRPPPETPGWLVRDGGAGDAPVEALGPRSVEAALDASTDGPRARAPRAGEVAIDELLVNPTGDDLGREWIELANRAPEPLDLSQLHLATASTDVAAPAGPLAPGALLLLGQSNDPSKNGGAPVTVAYNAKLILINANGQLSICVGACASGIVIDTVSWGALGDDQTGHALIVDPETKHLCTAAAPFGTAGSFGTPGALNPPCVENVDGGPRPDVSVAD